MPRMLFLGSLGVAGCLWHSRELGERRAKPDQIYEQIGKWVFNLWRIQSCFDAVLRKNSYFLSLAYLNVNLVFFPRNYFVVLFKIVFFSFFLTYSLLTRFAMGILLFWYGWIGKTCLWVCSILRYTCVGRYMFLLIYA